MNDFYNQAKHNEAFLTSIEHSFPDDYFDWKVTVIYYTSIHMLKCLAKKRGVKIGDTHQDIATSLNSRKGKQVTPFPTWAWNNYEDLLRYSKISRYDGINNRAIVLIAQKNNYNECKKLFTSFCSYMKKHGIEL
ncbi:hypothetical protein [Mucilaginibacter flavus]|uniref:hypothetical protein n=1 Tax=Mucilaginibacter flavus TaxID=931504 RepID=UPI0025B4CA45|nr:hypothetical protein [Mucilaginibacter flavus]MDN3582731.1 hypothetical protein [Mucilaginibacter flavus]